MRRKVWYEPVPGLGWRAVETRRLWLLSKLLVRDHDRRVWTIWLPRPPGGFMERTDV